MPLKNRFVLPLAGLLALAASCAHGQRPAEQTSVADEAQRNLREAQQEQQRAMDEEKNVAAARQEVVRAQQQLAQAQKKENEERTKLQQLQQQSNLHMRQAEQARQVAQGGAPAQAATGELGPQGQQIVSGHLLEVRPGQLTLQAQSGQTVTLDMNDQTRVFIGGERRSSTELQQGADARVAYENTTGRPIAITVDVPHAGPQAPSSGTTQPPDSPAPAPGYRAAPAPGSESGAPDSTQQR
jgi:hypothetical protein